MSTPVVDSARCVGHHGSKRMEWKGFGFHLIIWQQRSFSRAQFLWISVATQSINDGETNYFLWKPVPSFLLTTDWLC